MVFCCNDIVHVISSLQGVCADQSKVCGYHRFQQADFSQSVLAELRRLFEARSELLHQKVALHAYTALLSRLQVESYLYRLLKGEGHNMPVANMPLMHYTTIKYTSTYISFLFVSVIRLFWQPNTILFSATLERGHQCPV